MRRGTTTLAAVLTTLALAGSGCGSDGGGDEDEGGDFVDSSAEDIQAEATEDMQALSSLRMTGSYTGSGQEQSLDVAMNTDGECRGTIGIAGGSAEFISLADAAYLKGDKAFWEASSGDPNQAAAVVALVGENWAMLPGGGGSFGEACDLNALLDRFDEDGESDPLEKGEETEIDGTPALELTAEEDGETRTAWVATDDPHHILRITVEGEEPGEFTFSGFDEEVDLTAPPEDEVVDLSQAQ